METQIFLSYSRKDHARMHQIKSVLASGNIVAWTDEHLEPGTESWEMTIQEEIQNSLLTVVLLSPNSKESTWVFKKISYSRLQEKRIIPMLIAGTPKNSVPFSLSGVQYIDARENEDNAFKVLIFTIRRAQQNITKMTEVVESSEFSAVDSAIELLEEFPPSLKDDANALATYALKLETNNLRIDAMRELRKALMLEPRIRLKKWTEREYGWNATHHELFERIVMDPRFEK